MLAPDDCPSRAGGGLTAGAAGAEAAITGACGLVAEPVEEAVAEAEEESVTEPAAGLLIVCTEGGLTVVTGGPSNAGLTRKGASDDTALFDELEVDT